MKIKKFDELYESSKSVDELKDTLKSQPKQALKFIWDWSIQKRINFKEFEELIEYVTNYDNKFRWFDDTDDEISNI